MYQTKKCKKDEIEATQGLNLNNIDSVFILHDLYSIEETKNIKNAVKQLIDKKGNESNENWSFISRSCKPIWRFK